MLLRNVKIINHNEIIDNADIEINGSIITKITPVSGVAQNIVVPGFIDVHIHGFMGKDNMDSKEAVEFISSELKKVGTTSFLPTAMTESFENMNRSLKDISEARALGARILGSHLEGPFIALEKKGAHNADYLIKPTRELINELWNASNKTIRKMTIAPELFTDELIQHLVSLGIVPSIGHSNGKASDVEKAVKNGASACTHLWNAMTGIANRNPGVTEGILLSDKVYAELICDFIHVDKEAINLSIKSKGVNRIIATTDALKPAGTPDGDSISGGLAVTKKGNLITLKDSETIAGSGIAMIDNFKNLVSLGYDLKDVVAMTSYNAAQNLGVALGEIKINAEADIVVLDNNYNIVKVLVKGE